MSRIYSTTVSRNDYFESCDKTTTVKKEDPYLRHGFPLEMTAEEIDPDTGMCQSVTIYSFLENEAGEMVISCERYERSGDEMVLLSVNFLEGERAQILRDALMTDSGRTADTWDHPMTPEFEAALDSFVDGFDAQPPQSLVSLATMQAREEDALISELVNATERTEFDNPELTALIRAAAAPLRLLADTDPHMAEGECPSGHLTGSCGIDQTLVNAI